MEKSKTTLFPQTFEVTENIVQPLGRDIED